MKKIFIGMSILYLLAAVTNLMSGILAPEVYKEWANSALLPVYRTFMNSLSLSSITKIMVIIFIYQMSMSLCFFYGKGKILLTGLLLSIFFHTVIIPWGIWSLPNIGFVLFSAILLYKWIRKPVSSNQKAA